jgi:radical SAM superfamily enzyme YgiQ (UPF0313 family)
MQVETWDLNLDAWEYLLDPGRQSAWLSRLIHSLERLEHRRSLNKDQCNAYGALADGLLRGTAAVGHIRRAVEVLRTPAFFSPEDYTMAVNAIEGALAVVSARFHPARFEWGRYWPACSLHSSRAIVREATRGSGNPFVELSREVFSPRLLELTPDIVGISVTYLDQVVPAFTVAAECKRVLPEALVVLGGQIISLWGESLRVSDAFWRYVDGFVCGDGEPALRGLVMARLEGTPLEAVPNFIFRRQTRRRSALPTASMQEDVARLPCPDYSGLPLDRYLSPELVLTVSASRGCYWGRCTFCAVSPAFRNGFRARSTEDVLGDVSTLMRRHGARLFTFGDDALPRMFVRDLAEHGSTPPAGAMWQAELRWDAVADPAWVSRLAAAGARNLIFGFESASEKVLRRMRKGASLVRARQLLGACEQAAIGVNLQCFLGFPGETRSQVGETFSFLKQMAGPLTTVSCGIFELQKGSVIWQEPEKHGIRILRPPKEHDVAVRFEYEPCRGKTWRRNAVARIAAVAGARAPQLRCGINAHALIYMAHAERPVTAAPRPVATPAEPLTLAPGAVWREFAWDIDTLDNGVTPRRRRCCLAYSLLRGRPMSLGAITATILRHADGSTRLVDLLESLSSTERRRVRRAVGAMTARGLLSPLRGERR